MSRRVLSLLRRYALYLFRWQLSTPLLSICILGFAFLGPTWAAVIANFFGGLAFFWIDRVIFNYKHPRPLWEVVEAQVCHDCGKRPTRVYRLVKRQDGYDRMDDETPEWRCEECSAIKFRAMSQSWPLTTDKQANAGVGRHEMPLEAPPRPSPPPDTLPDK